MSFASKHVCGHSGHQIAVMVGVSRDTVAEYLRRAAVVEDRALVVMQTTLRVNQLATNPGYGPGIMPETMPISGTTRDASASLLQVEAYTKVSISIGSDFL